MKIFRILDHIRPDWILFDVAGGSDEVRMIERTGIEPALPEASPPVFPEIDRKRVFPIRDCHRFGQTAFGFRDSDQMNMVRHQTINPENEPRLVSVFLEKFEIINSIFVMKKDRLATIPPLNDMMGNTGDDDAGDTRQLCLY